MGLTDILSGLPEDDRKRAKKAMAGLEAGSGATERQLAENIKAEGLLPEADFAHLLQAFGQEALGNPDLARAFDEACKDVKLRGPAMGGVRPSLLARATDLPRLCSWISDRNPGLPLETVERLVRKHAVPGASSAPEVMAKAPLGRYVIWATFRNPNRDSSPFTGQLETKENVRTALGLGGLDIGIPWVLLEYRPLCDSNELKIPTVADAGSYPYFRPVKDLSPAPEHGWTEPLAPNANGLARQPEIVHSDKAAYTLHLPLTILE